MQGSDFVWLASIVIGMTLLAWLVLDWLESAQGWETHEDSAYTDANVPTYSSTLGRSEQYPPDPLDAELELMLCYPLDPFAPALLWRPQPQDQWIEVQEATGEAATSEQTPAQRPAQSASEAS